MSKNYFENMSREDLIEAIEYGANNINLLQEERDKTQNNWNELKKWLEDENNQKYSQYIYNYSINNWVLDKMQELEGNNE